MSILRSFVRLFQATVESHRDHDGDETTRAFRVPDLIIRPDGWFEGEDMERVPTHRTQSLASPEPLGFCWHWTATRGAGRRLAENIQKLPAKGERSASWGTMIPRDGPMYQSAPVTLGTWHAGGESAHSFHADLINHRAVMTSRTMANRMGGEVSANSLLHGVELENLGEVRLVAKVWNTRRLRWDLVKPEWRGWPFQGQYSESVNRGPGPVCPLDEIVEMNGRHYHSFSDHQICQAERLVRAAHRRYRWTEYDMLFTHKKIDPTRKSDPEPLWLKHLGDILGRVL